MFDEDATFERDIFFQRAPVYLRMIITTMYIVQSLW